MNLFDVVHITKWPFMPFDEFRVSRHYRYNAFLVSIFLDGH